MNCEVCDLKELELEVFQIREVLHCVLHSILFHRALGLVQPKDVDSEFFEMTYVQCGHPEVEKQIDEKIDEFLHKVEKHPTRKSQVCLSFYELKNKQPGWFSNKVERLYWEQWYINLNMINPKANSKPHHKRAVMDSAVSEDMPNSSSQHVHLDSSLREVLFQILSFVNEKKDHLPSIPSEDVICYPFEITFPSSSNSPFGWHTDVIKRMLQTGHPTMIG